MEPLTDDERYAAIRARDARFDGVFFTCVRTTGIFCRPSCPARTPQRSSVDFAPSAAAAIEAGFRACKRCGPAAPPGSPDADPAGSLAARALRLIEAGALDGSGVTELAHRLLVSPRTLHRALVGATGAGALTHARVARARRAHELVVGSDLPLSVVAYAAGFGSERQLHDTFVRTYGHAPSVVRARRRAVPADERPLGADTDAAQLRLGLAVRRPFDGAGLVDWFARRAVPGVEELRGTRWTRAVRLPRGPGVLSVDLGVPEGPLPLLLHLSDVRDVPAAVALARRLLDLDADPLGIDTGLLEVMPALAPLVQARPGVRLPGTPSLAEALLWAITGQQITALQARDQIVRATDLLSEALPAALVADGVERLPVDPLTAAEHAEDWFRGPGARRRALSTAVPAVPDEALGVDVLRASLLALPGIGPWTADYALLRGARAIDVAPSRDVALLAAARDLGLADDLPALDRLLRTAAPWRSYAVMHLWHHAAAIGTPSTRRTPAAESTSTLPTTTAPSTPREDPR
ncbi:Ada metal-binding domain-containing protein [Brachybacterium sp. AOP25-B2-12]|uniref:Ada metal-binding domain-containing protein n=1 Tax=Brachybacterium sp. AOP25-B2-12 TaxID=3457710 RepID=UPI004033C1AB